MKTWKILVLGSWGILGVPAAQAFRATKADFHLVAVEVQCPNANCDFSDEAAAQAVDFGFTGDGKFADPTQVADLNADPNAPRIVMGFPEDHFEWARFVQTVPGNSARLVVLNELSSSGKNHAFVSLWKPFRDSLEFVRLLPGAFTLPIGEISFQGVPRAEHGGALFLLKGIGSDNGVNLQVFSAVSLYGLDRLEKIKVVSNKTEIPVSDILARLNDGKPAEEVRDSSLQCELGRGPRGSTLRCTKSRTRILYTLQGPEETPLGSENFTLDLAASRRGAR